MDLAKVDWAAVGLKLYLSAGISSAAAMMYFIWRRRSLGAGDDGIGGCLGLEGDWGDGSEKGKGDEDFHGGALGVFLGVGLDCVDCCRFNHRGPGLECQIFEWERE